MLVRPWNVSLWPYETCFLHAGCVHTTKNAIQGHTTHFFILVWKWAWCRSWCDISYIIWLTNKLASTPTSPPLDHPLASHKLLRRFTKYASHKLHLHSSTANIALGFHSTNPRSNSHVDFNTNPSASSLLYDLLHIKPKSSNSCIKQAQRLQDKYLRGIQVVNRKDTLPLYKERWGRPTIE